MKKIKIFTSFLVLFLLAISTQVFAVDAVTTASKTPPVKAVLLATVNIQSPKIISQEGNNIKISFSLSNREGLQTGVKYGVKLLKETKVGDRLVKYVVDEKIYDESLTLNPNTKTPVEITYEAPTYLSGEYIIMLIANNTSNFMFGLATAGKVTLTSTTTGIQIISQTCYLQVEGEKSNAKYSLSQGVDIKSDENLVINCKVINTSKEDITATPKYENHFRSTYGDIVPQTGGDMTPILFKSNVETPITLTLPKALNPQAYNVNLTLVGGANSSNTVSAHYILAGSSATIQNLSFDKDYYTKGDTALTSLVYTPSADNFTGSRYKSDKQSALIANIKFTNGKDKTCAKELNKNIDLSSLKSDIPVAITSDCFNPKVLVTLSDESGKVLDQKEFSVNTTSVKDSNKDSNSNMIYIIIIILILIMIVFYIYKNKKNDTNPTDSTPSGDTSIPMSIIFPFFIFIALTLFTPTSKVSADVFTITDWTSVYHTAVIFDVNMYPATGSSDFYYKGSDITFEAYMSEAGCGNSMVFNSYLDASTNGLTIELFNESNWNAHTFDGGDLFFSGSGDLFAPDQVGWYEVTLGGVVTGEGGSGTSGVHSMPYEVVEPSVTVYANEQTGNTNISPNADLRVSWDAENVSWCECKYTNEYVTNADCTPASGPTVGTGIWANVYPYQNIAKDTVFNVHCE